MSPTNDETGKTPSGPAAVDRLRDRIDRGETDDKVPFSDPAAAPLGTDAEAAGAPPSLDEVRQEETTPCRPHAPIGEKPSPAERQAPARPRSGSLLVWLALAVIIAVLVFLIW